MENTTNTIEGLVERAEQYGKTSIELFKLKAIDRSAEIGSNLAKNIAILTFFSLFFLILNIGVALWLGDLLGKTYFGFFIISGFYAVVGIILYVLRDKLIKQPVKNSIILQALN